MCDAVGTEIGRVVTGHDESGKAVFASDESVDPLTAGVTVV